MLAQQVASERPKETLVVNINGAGYREAEGTIAVKLVASNATSRDAVITMAQLVHISLDGSGSLNLNYKQTGKLLPFKAIIVGGGKAHVFEVISEVDLEDFYSDGLEATSLPEHARRNARAGRLFLEVRAIDGFGKNYQNFFRIGTVTVFREGGQYVRAEVITNTKPLDAFETDTLAQVIEELITKK